MSWSKMTKRRLLRSLESDFEMVYVAQLCLSWEALNHQYRKVKELEFCISKNNTYCSNLAGEFQKFQILLERFMEDEQTSEGKRVQNYVQGRFSPKSLLQVPDVSGKINFFLSFSLFFYFYFLIIQISCLLIILKYLSFHE